MVLTKTLHAGKVEPKQQHGMSDSNATGEGGRMRMAGDWGRVCFAAATVALLAVLTGPQDFWHAGTSCACSWAPRFRHVRHLLGIRVAVGCLQTCSRADHVALAASTLASTSFRSWR